MENHTQPRVEGVDQSQLWVEALDQQWHSHCFTCTVSECVCSLDVCVVQCV